MRCLSSGKIVQQVCSDRETVFPRLELPFSDLVDIGLIMVCFFSFTSQNVKYRIIGFLVRLWFQFTAVCMNQGLLVHDDSVHTNKTAHMN